VFYTQAASAQNKIKWMTWEEALAAQEKSPRKILVDIYTDWCGWCKKMDKATFQKDKIAKYVNNNYYPVKFDAEYKDVIIYDGKEYKYIANGRKGYHELAVVITQGKLSEAKNNQVLCSHQIKFIFSLLSNCSLSLQFY